MVRRAYKLDSIDLEMLRCLEINGRISNIELAQMVGITASPCLRRLRALEENGIIQAYSATLNSSYFGYKMIIFASIAVKELSFAEKEMFESEISKIEEVLEIYALNLNTDYLVKIMVKNWEEYQILIKVKLLKIPYISKIRTTKIERTIKKQTKLPHLS